MNIKESNIEKRILIDKIKNSSVDRDTLKQFNLSGDNVLLALNKGYLKDTIVPMLEKHPILENAKIICYVCDELIEASSNLSDMYICNPHYVDNYMKSTKKVKIELTRTWNRKQIHKFTSINNIIDRYGSYDQFVDLKLKARNIDIISPLFDSRVVVSACDIVRLGQSYLSNVFTFNELTSGKFIDLIMDKNTKGISIRNILYEHNQLYALNQEKYNIDWLVRVINKYKNAKLVSIYLDQIYEILSDPNAIYKDIKAHLKWYGDYIVNIISIGMQKDPVSLIKGIYSGRSLNYIIKEISTLVNFVDENYPFCVKLRQQLRYILDTLIEEDFQN